MFNSFAGFWVFMAKGFNNNEPIGVASDLIAPNIEDLKYQTVKVGDFQVGELPTLPFGFFLPSTIENPDGLRINTFKIRPDLQLGLYLNDLTKGEAKAARQKGFDPNPIAAYLAKVVTHLGPYTLQEAANLLGVGLTDIFRQKGWFADISTILLGARMTVDDRLKDGKLANPGRKYAVDTQCPAQNCKQLCQDKTEEELHSINDVEIKMVTQITGDRPLWVHNLSTPISDGMSTITKLFLRPLKLQDASILAEETITDERMLTLMVAAIPESEIYGKVARPFCTDLYNRMDSDDIAAVLESISILQKSGPSLSIKVTCNCGDEIFDYGIPMLRAVRTTIYASHRPVKS